MESTVKFLVKRIELLTDHPANLFVYGTATKNYIRLAGKYAQRLHKAGRVHAANEIWQAIARFHEIINM